jgi:plasmid maintenance system antidote protein VapI
VGAGWRSESGHNKRSITADTALRLEKFFGISAQFWLNLQTRYDLEVSEDSLSDRLDKEIHALNVGAA